MADEKEPKPEGQRQKVSVEKTRAEDFKAVYVNSALVKLSVFDFRISLGTIPEDDKPDTVVRLEEHVQVMMSPQHAKAFLQVLEKNVKRYEDEFGQIQLKAKSAPDEPVVADVE